MKRKFLIDHAQLKMNSTTPPLVAQTFVEVIQSHL